MSAEKMLFTAWSWFYLTALISFGIAAAWDFACEYLLDRRRWNKWDWRVLGVVVVVVAAVMVPRPFLE